MSAGTVEPQAPITGFTTSIREYAKVEGIILRPAEAIVKYGTLVLIQDKSQAKDYLGMIVNVEEETPHPALDVERLRRLYQSISTASLEDANRVLMELLSPTHQLIKWSSIMRVEIRVLGEIRRAGQGERLDAYERPPRPFSSIVEPEPSRLEGIIHYTLGRDYSRRGLYIGRLSLYDKVRIYMNPSRLSTHLSILAQTGGGKTETVKRLVFEISQRRRLIDKPSGGIVVFDIAGEYTGYPYTARETAFLLDAVLKPEEYTGAVEDPYRPERVTIIVPYEASRGAWREQQKIIWEGMADLACRLADRLGEAIDLIVVFPRERRIEHIQPGGCKERIPEGRSTSYSGVASTVRRSKFLILGLPLPGFMDIDTMIELSGTQSEYFPIIISEIAGSLDLYHGGDIYGIGLLKALVTAWDSINVGYGKGEENAEKIISIYREACEKRAWNPQKLSRKITPWTSDASVFYGLMRYLAWKAYLWGAANPEEDSETVAVCKLLSNEELVRRVREALADLLRYMSSKPDKHILASAKRALWKLSSMTSDMVDTVLFDMVMDRLMEGFSIVHLAPPSIGNVDPLLSLVVKRLFYRHVGRYDPKRLTILVVEEAHNLAPAGEKKASKESLLRVAREGRKWGLSLWLVTQRPSFVDSSILSQTATSILLRTTNPEDLSSIKRSVESAAAELVERLPELEPTRGEALLTGLAAPERRIPLLVMVERLQRRA
ncbi:MAG: DUF87 domain-containing protein [Desulfurococcales archaeon]|nr:DUF87 domain-containing protein [Desulfurococcales archaeon]